METCEHEFMPAAVGFGKPNLFYKKAANCCIRCGKSFDEIVRHGFMTRAIADLLHEPQHAAFYGHELNSK